MMFALLLQVVWIAPEDPNCCGCDDPESDPPRPSIVSEWGEPLNGLSIRVLADSTQFDLGATVATKLEFRFDASGVEAPPSVLDSGGTVFGMGGALRFVPSGRPVAGAGIHEREPHIDAGPGGFENRCVAFCDIGQHGVWRVFFLLSDEGEQVPPGKYAMSARFENDGGPMVNRSRGRRVDPARCWAPPESIWIGAIESAPIEVEIVDRPPSLRTIAFPTRVELGCIENRQLSVWEDSTSTCTESVQIRPGYHFGSRTIDAMYVEDAEPIVGFWEDPEDLMRGRSPNAFSRWTNGSKSTSWDLSRERQPGVAFDWIADLLAQGTQYRFRRKYMIFESSVAPHSHWAPERGDYRVLAEHIVDAPWTMESICREATSSPTEASER